MSNTLLTVDQAATQLNLHPKTVLRYIREGRLEATRIGKSYRIARSKLDAFVGIASDESGPTPSLRTTCIVDIPDISVDGAERITNFLHAAAMASDVGTPRLHLETAFDPHGKTMKVVLIGAPSDVAKLLEMIEVHEKARP